MLHKNTISDQHNNLKPLRPADLAGYRSNPVFIRRSMHVPPSSEAVRDAMPVFFEMLAEEPEPSVRVVLGHFVFVHIHPYTAGNGRIGRFLMNVMLAAGGYPPPSAVLVVVLCYELVA